MVREEAIEFGNMWLKINEDSKNSRTYAFFQMAIKALEQELCVDCVSRQSVNDLVDELAIAIIDERCCIPRDRSTETIMSDIIHLPPVTLQSNIGHWVYKDGIRYCELCGASNSTAYTNYCPNCGAKMGSEE